MFDFVYHEERKDFCRNAYNKGEIMYWLLKFRNESLRKIHRLLCRYLSGNFKDSYDLIFCKILFLLELKRDWYNFQKILNLCEILILSKINRFKLNFKFCKYSKRVENLTFLPNNGLVKIGEMKSTSFMKILYNFLDLITFYEIKLFSKIMSFRKISIFWKILNFWKM